MENQNNSIKYKVAVTILAVLLLGALGGAGYIYYWLSEELTETQNELQSERERNEEKVSELEDLLARAWEESVDLSTRLQNREEELDSIRDQFNELVESVGTLETLQRTDAELLQKYSRVYFLNEHYFPSGITPIDNYYVAEENKTEYIHEDVEIFLIDLLEAAEREGMGLRIISAFRSFDEQSDLKAHYDVVYGAGTANQFSAAQGYSEHQLGTTVDFTTEELGVNFDDFGQTEGYQWLLENAHRYGFILSYPEGNIHYQFEPWHWRFVGIELATDLYQSGTHFYDMPQREIDEYRVKLFER